MTIVESVREELGQELPELAARHGVDPGRRLIEQQHGGLVHQGACEGELLLHATREPVRTPIAERRQLRHVEQAIAGRSIAANTVNLREERNVLVDGEVAVEREPLREIAHVRRHRAVLPDRVASEHADGAVVRLDQPARETDGCRLAGAIGSDESEHFPARDLERHIVQGAHRAVALGDRLERDRDGHPLFVRLAGIAAGYRGTISASTGIPGLRIPRRLSTLTLIR